VSVVTLAVDAPLAVLACRGPVLAIGRMSFCRCLTSATETGISVFKMMEVSQQKSVDTLHAYVRRSDLFKDTRAQRQGGS
jgi:hypothetical protein